MAGPVDFTDYRIKRLRSADQLQPFQPTMEVADAIGLLDDLLSLRRRKLKEILAGCGGPGGDGSATNVSYRLQASNEHRSAIEVLQKTRGLLVQLLSCPGP